MATDYQSIYTQEAEAYDRMVSAEDCDGALAAALAALVTLPGAAVVEVGAGTGRITRQLVARGARVAAFEPAAAMRAVAERRLRELAPQGLWSFGAADARALPPEVDGTADLAVAGWVFGHLRSWHPETWRHEIGRGLEAMARALRPGGVQVIVETLGTGTTVAAPPTEALAEYYGWLENTHGFQRQVLATDYAFESVSAAIEGMGFFFGEALCERIRANAWVRVPERTGLWWRRIG